MPQRCRAAEGHPAIHGPTETEAYPGSQAWVSGLTGEELAPVTSTPAPPWPRRSCGHSSSSCRPVFRLPGIQSRFRLRWSSTGVEDVAALFAMDARDRHVSSGRWTYG